MQNIQFIKLRPTDALPFRLLLLADETIEAIEKYIYEAEVYILADQQQTIGVAALYRHSADEMEIKNIAIASPYQKKGIGSFFITQIIRLAKELGYKTLIVGTAATGHQQLRFYERNGFRKYARRKNFFINNYPQPIYENGIRLKDMILLKQEL
ncbi:GNAT family N-acetyltransferase [Niabella beijingensis]|uniref:GNAT family N-acetyltransferase n=1 Tax=Niabella beijingensis TaxID=2872700 RepID=UPI001CC09B92|nr:GNAT family N-acetyltransferase [Niabella beijingensis]MBZ4187532.1 GNAT family N-acetyltransferase [Niabella beijingensis]